MNIFFLSLILDPKVKSRDKEDSHQTHNENKNQRFNDKTVAPRFKMNPNHANRNTHQEDNEDKMRSGGRDSKPVIKLKGDVQRDKPVEERKTGSILDRVIKAGDKGKRPLPTAHEEAKTENKYEKIEKKIKPDPISTTAPSST